MSNPGEIERDPSTGAAVICELSSLGILEVTGKDASRFLHGYVTCDIAAMAEDTWLPGAFCNIKGRMLSSFAAVRTGDDFLLAMDRLLVSRTRNFLAKYIPLFRKAAMEDASDTFRCFGIQGDGSGEKLIALTGSGDIDHPHRQVDHSHLLRMPEADRYQFWVHRDDADLLDGLLSTFRNEDAQAWWREEIRAGRGTVTEVVSEEFVPQMMNMSRLGAVSFSKGCYLGQEIVARMEYRGQNKRWMIRASLDSATPPAVGSEVLDGGGESAGTIVGSCATESGSEVLAVVRERDNYRLADGADLRVLDLPYA